MGKKQTMPTEKQQHVMDYMKKHMQEKSYFPTLSEMGRHFGVCSNAILIHIVALEKKGYLKRVPKKARAYILMEPER